MIMQTNPLALAIESLTEALQTLNQRVASCSALTFTQRQGVQQAFAGDCAHFLQEIREGIRHLDKIEELVKMANAGKR